MAKTTTASQFSADISDILKEFGEVVDEALESAVKLASKTVVDDLRQRSPKDTGKYAKSWTSKKLSNKDGRRGYYRLVYNKDRYYLTHLLEYGYVRRNGGRYLAQPHIQKATEVGMATFELKFLEGLDK